VTPKQEACVHVPSSQTLPAPHGVTPHDVGWQFPAAQRKPEGQVTPRQSGWTQLVPSQTWPVGHGVVPQEVG
jgi:hypothetical protein